MTNIAYITYQDDPNDSDPDLDVPFFCEALQGEGYNVELVDWQRSDDASNFDVFLIRSPWNYAQNTLAFESWLLKMSQEVQIINPSEVILQNMNKSYLFELTQHEIAIIPTRTVERLEDISTLESMNSKLVFKPIIGAGARGAFVSNGKSEVESKVEAYFLSNTVPLLVQPYLEEVDTLGEIAIVCCDGRPLHAIAKKPALSVGGHGDFSRKVPLDSDMKGFVEQINNFSFGEHRVGDLFYSRIDVVPTSDGYKLMELEVFEPTLFLNVYPDSAKFFAQRLKGHLA